MCIRDSSYELHCIVRMILLNDVCFVLHVRCDPFVPFFSLVVCINVIVQICGQFNEHLLLWQPSGIFLYSTVIILVLCCAGE